MMKRPSLAVWLACAFLLVASCDDDGGNDNGGTPTNDGGPQGDGDVGDGDTPGDAGDGDGDGDTGDGDGGPTGDGDGDGPDGGGDGDGDVETGSISGFVYDTAVPPQGVKNVMVQGPGNKSAMTTEGGAFVIDDMPVGKDVVITTKNAEHTQALKNVVVLKNQTSYVDIVVSPVVTGTFDPAKGGTVKSPDGAGVTFAPNTLVTKDGTDPVGDVTVAVGALEPTKAQSVKAFPGKSVAKNMSDQAGLIETYSPMEVRAVDSEGKELQVKAGEKATLDFPVSADITDSPDEIDLYTLLETTGTWLFDGRATKRRDDLGRFVYRAEVSHMTWWTCGTFTDEVTCVRGCVKDDEGMAVPGAEVSLTGIDHRLRDGEMTDEQGCFAANVRQDSQIAVLAASGLGVSALRVVQSDSEGKVKEDDPLACQDLGDITLVDRPAQGACPSGYTLCDDGDGLTSCVDLNNDEDRCGKTCAETVHCGHPEGGGVGGSNSVCIHGECQCPTGWEKCGDFCTNTKTDVYSCGACNPEPGCNAEEEICNNGVCETLLCDDGLSICFGRNGLGCADTDTSASHCGSCGYRCGNPDGDPGPEYRCEEGQCECQAGYTKCPQSVEDPSNIRCYDVQTDPENCGACGYDINGGANETAQCDYNAEICVSGACQAVVCDGADAKACNRQCVDTATSEEHCGDCGNYCDFGKECRDKQCQCPVGQQDCNGTCIDPQTDPNNCGGCLDGGGGSWCSFDQACVQGTCLTLPCNQGQSACNHQCIDTLADEANCGGCNIFCSTEGQYPGECVEGKCTCPAETVACEIEGGYECRAGGCIITEPNVPD